MIPVSPSPPAGGPAAVVGMLAVAEQQLVMTEVVCFILVLVEGLNVNVKQ